MAANDTGPFTFTRDYSVPRPRSEQAYLIPASEWERLKRMIRRIAPAQNWFQVGASVCAGVFFTAVFSLVSFSQSKEVPQWAKIVAWVCIFCGALLTIALVAVDKQQTQQITVSANDVLEEMTQLEASHASESSAEPVEAAEE